MSGVSARTRALAGSIGFFVVGPVLEAGIGPWVITGGFSRGEGALDATSARVAGVLLIAAGVVVVVQCFVTFVRDGIGTPSPLAPTAHLIVRGPYRHVRNPMYVATATIIAGEGLLLARIGPVQPQDRLGHAGEGGREVGDLEPGQVDVAQQRVAHDLGDATLEAATVRVAEAYPEVLVGAQALAGQRVLIDQRHQTVAVCPAAAA